MPEHKPIMCSLVFVGPFGTAPYTHPGFVVGALLPELQSMQPQPDIVVDSAMGAVFFNTRIADFVVHASAARFEIKTTKVTAENIVLLGRVSERMAAAAPSAMATSVGFNVSFQIEDFTKLIDGVLPREWLGMSDVTRSSFSSPMGDGTSININVSKVNTSGARLDFNFDYRVNESRINETPLVVAKNWSEKISFEQRIAFAKELCEKMVYA